MMEKIFYHYTLIMFVDFKKIYSSAHSDTRGHKKKRKGVVTSRSDNKNLNINPNKVQYLFQKSSVK